MIVHIMGDLHARQGGVFPGDASRCWVSVSVCDSSEWSTTSDE